MFSLIFTINIYHYFNNYYLVLPRIMLMTLRLQLYGAIYCPDSFVLMLCYCASLKAIRYESATLNRIVADKSHRVIVA